MRQTRPPPDLSESDSYTSPSYHTVIIHRTGRRQALSHAHKPDPRGRTDASLVTDSSQGLAKLVQVDEEAAELPLPTEQVRVGVQEARVRGRLPGSKS